MEKKDSNYSLLSLSSKYKVNAFRMRVPYNAILIRDVLIIQQIELCSYFPGKLFIKVFS